MPGHLPDYLQEYLAILDVALLSSYGLRLLQGLCVTIEIAAISCALGFVLAYAICAARMSGNVVLTGIALCYVTFFRATPLLCLLYLFYYGAGELRPLLTSLGLWGAFREALFCCVLALTLNTAAYQAEIMRGALGSVPGAQVEAARALGLSKFRIQRHVVWPQALRVALRPFGNEIIGVIKASSLVAMVTVLDLMGQTRAIFAATFDFSIYLYAALLYLIMTELVRRATAAVEQAWSRHLAVAVEAAGN